MKIAERLNAKQEMNICAPVTIAFLGDSVTQGCFECFIGDSGNIETVHDYSSAFSTHIREYLNLLYPNVQINIINSGLSGGAAPGGLRRLERDVLQYHPDLVVVSFGLNDCCNDNIPLPVYKEALQGIFARLQQENIEAIFLTQNFMNTKISSRIPEESLREGSALNMKRQIEGVLKQYMEQGAAVAREYGVQVCDLYSVWEKLAGCGVDTTNLLANRINHPIRQIHHYMAIKLIETMLDI